MEDEPFPNGEHMVKNADVERRKPTYRQRISAINGQDWLQTTKDFTFFMSKFLISINFQVKDPQCLPYL